ncbi:DUF4312 family protein [Alkaliphilus peptidifermentans]|uniref:Uncharacterized protein n=1 Tax=Alkaliphilus peptidifermentans DSM 18978 TaxID=1120976 RepID=A0A1G5ISS4_9FIRM|nr:DUF4312 family protein [Alkaliphilus peptidifermentans]SCY79017.1 conserved hypothetical protein EF_0831/AHA_3912 [Alkaliphilus peptidifermentans DSM 18978]
MENKQLMKTIHKEFIFEATGKSKEEFFGNVFSMLRKKVYTDIEGVILHMEPVEVYVLNEKEETYTERFLWLFMPRTKGKYTGKVRLVVIIKYIEM